MKRTQTRPRQSHQIRDLATLSMFTAILFLLAFTPIGLIDLPVIKATILHIPVIIGALLLGPRKGAFLGGMFGLASLVKNTLVPNLSSFLFSPLIPVPGLDRGSPLALVVCFLPRVLVGVLPWAVWTLLRRAPGLDRPAARPVLLALSAAVGSLTNTALVLGLTGLFFSQAYAAARGIPVDELLGFFLGVTVVNGLPEAAVAAIIVPAVCLPLWKALATEEAARPGRSVTPCC